MFDGIIGNEHIKKMFSQRDYQLRNTYIFNGIEGIGKFTMAKEIAMDRSEYNQNILIIDSDKDIVVDDIRSIEDFIYRPPFGKQGNKRTVIINNAQTMSSICQNMLLKVLENPPEFALFILICSDLSSLLSTVKSRAFNLLFYPPSIEEIRDKLSFVKDSGLLEFMIVAVDGSVAKVLTAESNMLYYQNLYNCCMELEKLKDTRNVYSVFKVFKEHANSVREMTIIYNWYAHQYFELFRRKMENDKFKQYHNILLVALKIMENTNDFDLVLDIMLLKICKYNGRK